MTTLSKIISTSVDNDSSSEDAVRSNQRNLAVGNSTLGDTGAVSGDVSEVTDMAVLVRWGTVGLSEGVEMRTSRCAAVGVVTESMDMEATLGICIVSRDLILNGGWGGLRLLGEGDNSCDVGVSTEDGNCFDHFDFFGLDYWGIATIQVWYLEGGLMREFLQVRILVDVVVGRCGMGSDDMV